MLLLDYHLDDRCCETEVQQTDAFAQKIAQREPVKFGVFTVLAFRSSVCMVQLNYGDQNYGGFPWSLPGGGVDPGEAPSAAAIREVEEEVGLQVLQSSLQIAGVFHRPYVPNSLPDGKGEITFLFACDLEEELEPTPSSNEIRSCGLFEFDLDRWLAVPATGSGEYLQPLRRHWIYWTQIGARKLRETNIAPVMWTYESGKAMGEPVDGTGS